METTDSRIQGAKVVSVYTAYNSTTRYISVTLELPNGEKIDLEPDTDGYGACWING